MQLLYAIPKSWINSVSDVKEYIHNQHHHLMRKRQIYLLNKTGSKKFFFFLSERRKNFIETILLKEVK